MGAGKTPDPDLAAAAADITFSEKGNECVGERRPHACHAARPTESAELETHQRAPYFHFCMSTYRGGPIGLHVMDVTNITVGPLTACHLPLPLFGALLFQI